jgi:hypothetical protein
MHLKHLLFRILLKINTWLLPSYIYRDLTRLSKLDQAIIAYRIWLTKKSLRN